MATVNIQHTKAVELQLKLTNYAEGCEKSRKPQFFVMQISFLITVLPDDDVDAARVLQAKDQEVLNWQARADKLPDDIESRNDLTSVGGRLCPTRKISSSLFDKVTAHVTEEQARGRCPLSAFRLVSFRSIMLTKHSASDGQVQLLFQNDGLPKHLSSLRWRSHDYIKLTFSKARPSYTVFTLVHWDIVNLFDPIPVELYSRTLSLDNPSVERPADIAAASGKLWGIRNREKDKRKSPWIANLRIKGFGRQKLWLGSFKSREAAARAVDAANIHYNLGKKLYFDDSRQYVRQMPPNLSHEDKKKFVKAEAKLLASLADENPSTHTASTEGLASPPLWEITNLGITNLLQPASKTTLADFQPGFLAPGSMYGPSSSGISHLPSQLGEPRHDPFQAASYNYQDSVVNRVSHSNQFTSDMMSPPFGQNPDMVVSSEVAEESDAQALVSDSDSDNFGQFGRPADSGGFISDASLLIGSNRDVERPSYLYPVVFGDFLGLLSDF